MQEDLEASSIRMINRILLVDDEPYNIQAMLILLKLVFKRLNIPESYVEKIVDHASDGHQAVNQFLNRDSQQKYSLILMDCSMPIKDGYTACKEMRLKAREAQWDQPYIVACTGHTEEQFIRKAFRSEFNEVLPKPASIDVLEQIMERVMVYRG